MRFEGHLPNADPGRSLASSISAPQKLLSHAHSRRGHATAASATPRNTVRVSARRATWQAARAAEAVLTLGRHSGTVAQARSLTHALRERQVLLRSRPQSLPRSSRGHADSDHSARGAARVSTRRRRGRDVAELPAVPTLLVPAAARASILPQLLPSMKPEVAPEPLRHTRMTLPQAANTVQPRRSGDIPHHRRSRAHALAKSVERDSPK